MRHRSAILTFAHWPCWAAVLAAQLLGGCALGVESKDVYAGSYSLPQAGVNVTVCATPLNTGYYDALLRPWPPILMLGYFVERGPYEVRARISERPDQALLRFGRARMTGASGTPEVFLSPWDSPFSRWVIFLSCGRLHGFGDPLRLEVEVIRDDISPPQHLVFPFVLDRVHVPLTLHPPTPTLIGELPWPAYMWPAGFFMKGVRTRPIPEPEWP